MLIFRLIVHVKDGLGSTSLTLFNKEAEELIGVQVDKIIAELPEIIQHLSSIAIKNDSYNKIPIIFTFAILVVGKKCAFTD